MWKLVKVLFVAGAIGITGWTAATSARPQIEGGARGSIAATQAIMSGQVLNTGYQAAAEKDTIINPFGPAQEAQAAASSSRQIEAKADNVIDLWRNQYPDDEAAKKASN